MTTNRLMKLALAAAVLFVTIAPAHGQGNFVAGVRVIQNSFDGTNLDIDFVEYYTASWSAFSTAFIGGSNVTEGFYQPAVDWGDGSVEPPVTTNNPGTGLPITATSTTVNGVPVHIFRGNYTHAFGAPPTNPVVVAGRAGLDGSGYNVVPSNATQLVYGNLQSHVGPNTTIFIATDNLPFAGPPVIEIPTASEAALLSLALLLAAAAFVVLRRRV